MKPVDRSLVQELLSTPLPALMQEARRIRDAGHGDAVSYSRKVFVPLTQLCRDVCHYCTFSRAPKAERRAFMSLSEVLAISRAGLAAGCDEVLFTLGDSPESRWQVARDTLAEMGHDSTLSYLHACCDAVLKDGGPLPHLNAGLMSRDAMLRLREVSVSMGLMLENVSPRLMGPGQAHHGSPTKDPRERLRVLELAGELRVPFTSGILIGIGETREERLLSLLALRDSHHRHGHLQEVIVQNFRAKSGTPMAAAEEPGFDELCWTLAAARVLLGPQMNLQAPPNLSPGSYRGLIEAGLNDWGGVSPVTLDHVNPEAAWPHLEHLAAQTAMGGKRLVRRLPVYPGYASAPEHWIDPGLHTRVLARTDARGWPRDDGWRAGSSRSDAAHFRFDAPVSPPRCPTALDAIVARCRSGARLTEREVTALFHADGHDLPMVLQAADELRAQTVGDAVGYVVNRNINYTNVCTHRCGFCAFSKGRASAALRGTPYDLADDELTRRVNEAWMRGATEVCLQGGIHPDYDGRKYLRIVRLVKSAQAQMHVHAFSPLEVFHGASTLGLSLGEYLAELRAAGLGTLPGTAAEILHDDVRRRICPGKLDTATWLEVMRTAHGLGLRTTATIMFGHLERPVHWAAHLLAIRDLQEATGGFTEFVPLPFVAAEAPMYLRGLARPGPTAREAVLMHAVARLVLHPHIRNVQASWVKLGTAGAVAALRAGANDLGGTLMNESISRAAGAQHGQELAPLQMESLIGLAGRRARQRTTLYENADEERRAVARRAQPLAPVVQTPVVFAKRQSSGPAQVQSRSMYAES